MFKFIIKRFFYGFLVLFGVTLIVFLLFQVLPGDPVNLMMGHRGDVTTRENIMREFGLNEPAHVQLGLYLKDLSPLSVHEDTKENQDKYEYKKLFDVGENSVLALKVPYLRRSYQSNRKVNEIIYDHIGGTFWLAFTAMAFATVIGISMGIFAALNQNRFWDHFLVITSVFGISAPSFVTATLVALIFGYYLSEYTGLSIEGNLWETTYPEGRHLVLKNLVLPAFSLGVRPLAIIVQLTRSSMLEVLGQDYIRTARAKGLNYWRIIYKHALKNALNPVITAVSGWLASLMAGAFFIEYIFNWKGLGSVTIKAVFSQDLPVVMGSTLFIALIFICVNIVVDVFYAIIDPRVRLK